MKSVGTGWMSGRQRSARPVIAAVGMAAVIAVGQFGPAATAGEAAAAPVRSADQLLVDYKKLNVEAEKSAEAMHNAQIEIGRAHV